MLRFLLALVVAATLSTVASAQCGNTAGYTVASGGCGQAVQSYATQGSCGGGMVATASSGCGQAVSSMSVQAAGSCGGGYASSVTRTRSSSRPRLFARLFRRR